jgi:hypothetical protein
MSCHVMSVVIVCVQRKFCREVAIQGKWRTRTRMASIPLPPDETCTGHSEPPLRRHRVESAVSDALDAVIKLALAKAKHDATSYDLGQPVTNPCLKSGAVYRQFLAALGDAPLLDADGTLAKDVLLVYHGTRSVKNAKRIMCEGFDPMKRVGQSFGAGEYFADTLGTSLEYAQTTGAIMLCAVFGRRMCHVDGQMQPKITTPSWIHQWIAHQLMRCCWWCCPARPRRQPLDAGVVHAVPPSIST